MNAAPLLELKGTAQQVCSCLRWNSQNLHDRSLSFVPPVEFEDY